MPVGNRMIGIDRTIQLNWIDSAVEMLLKGYTPEEIWIGLDPIIGSVLTGKDARRKCKTVIFRVWIKVPQEVESFRDEALGLMKSATKSERIVLHWIMCCVAYPFFRDFTATLGKMLKLQDDINSQQVIRRIVEKYGERSTAIRATQRLFVSLVNWGVITETADKHKFSTDKIHRYKISEKIVPWMVEGVIRASGSKSISMENIRLNPSLFPFDYEPTLSNISTDGRFEINRHALNENLITLK